MKRLIALLLLVLLLTACGLSHQAENSDPAANPIVSVITGENDASSKSALFNFTDTDLAAMKSAVNESLNELRSDSEVLSVKIMSFHIAEGETAAFLNENFGTELWSNDPVFSLWQNEESAAANIAAVTCNYTVESSGSAVESGEHCATYLLRCRSGAWEIWDFSVDALS